MRRRNGRTNQSGEAEVDENFWAQNANQAAQGNDSELSPNLHLWRLTNAPLVGMDEPNPFDTQIFGDFDDGGGFDDDGPDMGPSTMDLPEQDLLAGTQGQSRRVRPEKVNYAKKAKRIDVKQLKDNIWKNLNIVCPEKKEEEGEDVSMVRFRSCVYSRSTRVLSFGVRLIPICTGYRRRHRSERGAGVRRGNHRPQVIVSAREAVRY